MGKIYIATSGCGKTYFCKHNLNWIDLDYYLFDTAIKNEAAFLKFFGFYNFWDYNIFTNNPKAINWLQQWNVKIDAYILPTADMKSEMIERLRDRKDKEDKSGSYFEEFSKKFDAELAIIKRLDCPKIYLKPGQYITDVLDSAGNIKPGVKVIK